MGQGRQTAEGEDGVVTLTSEGPPRRTIFAELSSSPIRCGTVMASGGCKSKSGQPSTTKSSSSSRGSKLRVAREAPTLPEVHAGVQIAELTERRPSSSSPVSSALPSGYVSVEGASFNAALLRPGACFDEGLSEPLV